MFMKIGHRWFVLILLLPVYSVLFGIEPYEPEMSNPFLEIWRWKHFEELDGKGVKNIVEGKSGNIWFSTNQGIYEYDGYSFHLHDTLNGLTGLPVYDVAKTNKGELFASTRDGLFFFEDNTWRNIFFDPTHSLDIQRMRAVEEQGLFCLTKNGFLRVMNDREIQVFTSEELIAKLSDKYSVTMKWTSLPDFLFKPQDHAFTDIITDEKGYFWLCVNNEDDGRVLIVEELFADDSIIDIHNVLSSEDHYQFGFNQRILKDSNGDIWLINGNFRTGIHVFRRNGDHSYIKLSRLFGGDEFHWSIIEDNKGEVLISGLGQFFVHADGKWNHYTADDVPIPPSCRVIISNIGDNLWIGGYQNKIYKLDYSYNHWATYNNLNFQCESPDGKKWFIEAKGKIIVKDGEQWQAYVKEDGLIDTPVRLICTRNGQLWVAGSHEGVAATAYLKNNKWVIQKHPYLSWGIDYRSVFEANDGSLWCGASVDYQKEKGQKSGLIRLKDPMGEEKKWVHYYTPQHGAMSYNTYGIAQSLDGRIWKGGLGLSYFDGNRWFKIESPSELTDYVNIVHSRPGVKLHAGSRYYGLFVFDGDHWKVFNSNTGLTSNTVISIYALSDSSIWLATDNDISYFNGSQWFVDLFPREMTMKMEGGSLYEDGTGKLWINKSPREWKRRALEYSQTTEDVYEKFKVFRYQAYIGAPETYLKQHSEQIPASGQITFFWEGKDYFKGTEDKKLKYAYRLNGGEWSEFSPKTNHTFYKLPSGKYVFEVRSIDQDMNTDRSFAKAEFVVLPPIWKQGWFVFLILGMTFTILYFIVQIIKRDQKLLTTNKELNNANEVLSEQKEEITTQKENLNKIFIKNEELSKTKLKFYTNISHEFRTPLTLILANIEDLLYRNLNFNERTPIYKIIQRNAHRLLDLINQLLEFRKIESGTIKLITRKGDLVRFIKELTELFNALARNRNIKLIVTSDQLEEFITFFDPDKIEKILYNLLSNAFRYTPDGGRIEVNMSLIENENDLNNNKHTEKFFKISVKDYGKGISEKNLKQIFNRYFSDDSEKKYALENTGIGLSYVKDLVTAHGGSISVDSKLHQGTTFDVFIPCFNDQPADQVSYERELLPEDYLSENVKFAINEFSREFDEDISDFITENEGSINISKEENNPRPSILIVEDNHDMRDYLRKTLASRYRISLSRNGQQALQLAARRSFELILSDVMMPVMDGLELCKELKSNINTSHIPVILLTAKSFNEHQIEGLETGADDYIVKPFNSKVLLARIENILENRRLLKKKFSRDFSFEPKEVKLPSADTSFLNKLVKLMEEQMSDPEFNVDKMAKEMCISHASFILKVRGLTGQKPHNLLKSYRLKRAKQLLRQKEISVSEVAYSVGYDNPSSFTRAFKAMYKQSPSEYMDNTDS